MPETNPDELIDEKQVSTEHNINLHTLRKWRCKNRGPRFIKLSRGIVRYRRRDVAAWLASRPSGGEQVAAAA
jgi:predicted DNA-binding transcriptional regulator AlpA